MQASASAPLVGPLHRRMPVEAPGGRGMAASMSSALLGPLARDGEAGRGRRLRAPSIKRGFEPSGTTEERRTPGLALARPTDGRSSSKPPPSPGAALLPGVAARAPLPVPASTLAAAGAAEPDEFDAFASSVVRKLAAEQEMWYAVRWREMLAMVRRPRPRPPCLQRRRRCRCEPSPAPACRAPRSSCARAAALAPAPGAVPPRARRVLARRAQVHNHQGAVPLGATGRVWDGA